MSNSNEKRQTIFEDPGVVTPEMFGAVGDGVADDSLAFQSAVDSGSVVLCTQNYRISGIVLAANTAIKGNNSSLIPIYGNSDAASTMFYGTNIDTVSFEGLKFVGSYPVSTNAVYTQPLVRIDGGVKVSISNCSFTDIDGSYLSQYSEYKETRYFWDRHGQVIDIKGVLDTYITECIISNPSAREAIWIMPNSSDLSDINVHINGMCFYGCVGQTPLNMLCQNAEINNLFFDSACSFGGSAVNVFGKVIVADGIVCNGAYLSILDCMEWGLFRNSSVMVSNMNVVSHEAVAVASVADKVVLTNLTLSCASIFTAFNVVRDMSQAPYNWDDSYFPWKKTAINKPDVRISNVNMTSYDGLYPPVLLKASYDETNTGHISLQNCDIKITVPNSTYSTIMLYCAGLSMDNCNISGISKVHSSISASEYAYVGYVSSRSSVRDNHIVINGCTFENTSGYAHMVAKIYGFMSSFRAVSNKCIGSFSRIVSGFFSSSVICHKNDRTTGRSYPDAQIGFGRFITDFPVALGMQYRGDLNVESDNTLRYRYTTCVKYNREAAQSVTVRVGDIFKHGIYYLCVARSTNTGSFTLSDYTVPSGTVVGDVLTKDGVDMIVIASGSTLTGVYTYANPQGEITNSYMGYSG